MGFQHYKYWLSEDGLLKLEAYARDGYDFNKIAGIVGVSDQTLRAWRQKYPAIDTALNKNREIPDIHVENALYRKCLGYEQYQEKVIKLRYVEYDPVTGKKLFERDKLKRIMEKSYYQPDTLAIFFYLKNRLPKKWRDNPIVEDDEAMKLVVEMIAKMDAEAKRHAGTK